MGKNLTAAKLPFSFDRLIEIAYLVTVFLTPIIFDRRLGIVFSGTKVAWLRIFIISILALWAIKLVVTKQHRFIRSLLDWPVLAFLLTTTIATLTSVHVYTSFTGFYGRFEGLTTWYLFGLLFFISTNFLHSAEQLKRVIVMIAASSTMMSVYGVIQRYEMDPYMWGGVVTWQRVIGTIGQPNFLAAFVLMAFFATLILFLEERKVPGKIDWNEQLICAGYFAAAIIAFLVMIYTLDAQDIFLWYSGFAIMSALTILFAFNYQRLHPAISKVIFGSCMFLAYVCLLFTQSRGGYMGFFTGAVLFGLIAGRHWLFNNWKRLAVLAALIVGFSLLTMLRPEYSPFERFSSEVSTKQDQAGNQAEAQIELKGAAGSRGETWKSAFKIIADYPVFGVGPEVLKMVFPRYETDLFRFKEAFHVKQDRCHNETFDVPVTKGLISFALYLWIIILLFKAGLDRVRVSPDQDRLVFAGLLAAALAYLIQNQFSFGVVAITSIFWVIWGLVMVQFSAGQGKFEEKPENISWEAVPWLPVALIIALAALLAYISMLSFRGDIYFKSGKGLLEMRQLPGAAAELQKSLSVFPLEGAAISHLAITYLNMGSNGDAVKYLNYGAAVDPYNADNFYMLARLNIALYDRGDKPALALAEKYSNYALKVDPYYAEQFDTLGQIYERQGKLAEAAAMYQKAFFINPHLTEPMQRLIDVYNKLGRSGAAKAVLEEAARKYPDSLEVFKVLGQLK